MKTTDLILLPEIKKYPIHYIEQLITDTDNLFLLYQYGPYIATHYKRYIDREALKPATVNPLLLLMIDISDLLEIVNSKGKIVDVKMAIIKLMKRCTSEPYKYSNTVHDIAMSFIHKIRKYQYDTKSLESALLNYAPIVQYAGILVKPELSTPFEESSNNIDISHDQLSNLIDSFLVNNILDIMSNPEDFIDVFHMRENLNDDILDVPAELIKYPEGKNRNTYIYFFLVTLRYIVPEDRFNDFIHLNIKINNTYNIVIKEAMLNVLRNS